MDRLIVLEAGAIIEHGHHDQLLARRGHYAALWEHQSGGFLQELAG
jgi:ABC-type multidrug transport system fused ATPase/permease subunit